MRSVVVVSELIENTPVGCGVRREEPQRSPMVAPLNRQHRPNAPADIHKWSLLTGGPGSGKTADSEREVRHRRPIWKGTAEQRLTLFQDLPGKASRRSGYRRSESRAPTIPK